MIGKNRKTRAKKRGEGRRKLERFRDLLGKICERIKHSSLASLR
jgi:hypothetical protein